MSIPAAFVQELLARTDIVELIGRYVALKKGGANFMGLCPFHAEKSPSFSVSPSKQFYHCFGCGAHGNAISFLMAHHGVGFVEAVRELAQQHGLSIPDEPHSRAHREHERRARQQRQSLTALLADVAKAYQHALRTSSRAIDYLKSRGLTGEVALRFGLGYAPAGWRPLASLIPDYADPRLVQAGLVIDKSADEPPAADTPPGPSASGRRYDRFRDRIMFPIRNVRGEVIAFGGRVLDRGEPKYLNSPETPVFSKGHELYGLHEARADIRSRGHVLVTEGYMDVVALAQHGFGQAVATLGTACTSEHVQKLFRFTDTIIFSFDGDAAGRRAAAKALHTALPFATDARRIRFLFLPPEHDPDSYIRSHGPEAFAAHIEQALPLSRYLLDHASEGNDLRDAEGRARTSARAQPLWASLPEGMLKRQLLTDIASALRLSPEELLQSWTRPDTPPAPPHIGPQPENRFEKRSTFRNPEERSTEFSITNSQPASSPSPPSHAPSRWPQRLHPARWAPPPPARPPLSGGLPPNARLHHVARTLLLHPVAWSSLSPDDLDLLAHAPEPLGALLRWLEHQWHEHGAQPWAVLEQALAPQPFAPLAQTLVREAPSLHRPDPEQAQADALLELRQALLRMHIEHLQTLTRQAAAEASHNPEALQQWRAWEDKRQQLLRELHTLSH